MNLSRPEEMNMPDRVFLRLVLETLLKCKKLPLFTSQKKVRLSLLKVLCHKCEYESWVAGQKPTQYQIHAFKVFLFSPNVACAWL